MKPVIAFISDVWRRRFGWDEKPTTTVPAVTVTIRSIDGEQIRDLLTRSTPHKEQ